MGDAILDCLPQGRIVEIVGGQSSGKTTLSLKLIKQIQNKQSVGIFIDADHKLNVGYFENYVDVNSMYFYQPRTTQEILEVIKPLLETKMIGIIVIDSLGALHGENDTSREVKNFIMELARLCYKYNCTGVLLNQYRFWDGKEVPMYNETVGMYASVRCVAKETDGANKVELEVKTSKMHFQTRQYTIDI